jgi:hypothetical protein
LDSGFASNRRKAKRHRFFFRRLPTPFILKHGLTERVTQLSHGTGGYTQGHRTDVHLQHAAFTLINCRQAPLGKASPGTLVFITGRKFHEPALCDWFSVGDPKSISGLTNLASRALPSADSILFNENDFHNQVKSTASVERD